ncbi:MAG: molybdopterin-dependent oxidoreductase [bacterium]|jgi:anaerobic dimethyl sulfoxide reductase subunit A
MAERSNLQFPASGLGGEYRIVPTTCVNNCGGKCLLLAHVKDGVIVRLTSDNISDDQSLLAPQLRACARGRAYRQRVYHPDRLLYPLKRIGARGEGKFVRIGWEEALDTVAGELWRIKATYGNTAILDLSHTGAFGGKLHYRAVDRFLNMFGCRTVLAGYYSTETTDVVTEHMCGTTLTGNDRADLLNSRLILLWGFNPAETVHGTNTSWFIARARENGARVVCIDPRLTDTAAVLADRWIPIRPGTDTAVLAAMAYEIIAASRHDTAFLAAHTVGFERFRDYVMGVADGVKKTPQWADTISGVPAATIAELAADYASIKPGALLCGWSLQRTAFGEQPVRLAVTLAAITGNIGIPGGSTGGADYSRIPGIPGLPVPPLPDPAAQIPVYVWADAVLQGKAGGYPSDIKAVYSVGGNLLNQGANLNKNIAALRQVEFMVSHEQFRTPTAKFADIVLPACTFLERSDICTPGAMQGNYLLYANKVIEPLPESKSDYAIFAALAERLGFGNAYTEGREEEDWLRSFVANSPIPDFEQFKRTGIYRDKRKRPHVAFARQIQKGKQFATPSGKIEIYSQRLADLNDPLIPPIPRHLDPWEGPTSPLAAAYPLQLITAHSKKRVNSSHANTPCLQDIEPDAVWVNSRDAGQRGIRSGDLVRVFNDRGSVVLPAFVTERIMPGVVNIYQGSWYSPDQAGNDRGGNPNILNLDRPTPLARGSTTHTTLVEIELNLENPPSGGVSIE